MSGFDGTEGQLVLVTGLPFGPEREGRIGMARASARSAAAASNLQRDRISLSILDLLGRMLRDQRLVESAREESRELTRFADVLALQADQGRRSKGEAARAVLAEGLAATHAARREAGLARSAAELAFRLGLPGDTRIVLSTAPCQGSSRDPLEPPLDGPPSLAEVELARANAAWGEAQLVHSRGARTPDLRPQVGLKRLAGLNALYLGLSTDLPLFDLGQAGVASARAEALALAAERDAAAARMEARIAQAGRTLAAFEQAGRAFDSDWFDAAEQTITAARARYDLGEGTLLEFLDARRARLAALDDYATWLAEWWNARANLVRLQGGSLDGSLLCSDPQGGAS